MDYQWIPYVLLILAGIRHGIVRHRLHKLKNTPPPPTPPKKFGIAEASRVRREVGKFDSTLAKVTRIAVSVMGGDFTLLDEVSERQDDLTRKITRHQLEIAEIEERKQALEQNIQGFNAEHEDLGTLAGNFQ